ncbi:hypothetical protein LPJ73_002195 [Coemansia sp. RSA 2703]|nr:hypothetical protein LPJ73_002195 [Coemansia sp. RSA 2703]KAJ2366290.1 hypothetical protein IW150_005977 [Coemansia sp. RSA 2607]KAJ2386341.1 hypothetical protein GGI05_004409 [Coemansia sp. RSA 2603]
MSLPFNVQRSGSKFGIDDPMGEDPGLFNLSRTERYMAFGACFVVGLVLSVLGTVLIFSGHMAAFAVCYSLGNVISLLGMGFLIGFKRQLKMATQPVRLTAFLIYIGLLIATFITAFTLKIGVLCLILAICQFCALAWYSASYVPFGRKLIKNLCGACARAI